MRAQPYRLLALVIFCGCAEPQPSTKGVRAPPPIEDGVFVESSEGELRVAGASIHWMGVNAALTYGESVRADSERLLGELDAGELRVARVWVLGETDGTEDWRRHSAFRMGPEGWVEESFEHLDRMLVHAREAGVRVILTLANRWRDHGGLPQYARWSDIPVRYDNLMPAEMRATLHSERTQSLYLEHVRRVVGRTNAITGRPYAEDPTILAWELFNEVSAQTTGVQQALLAFLDRAAEEVRELDANHLIAAGHIGYNSEQSRRFWREIHARPWVGFADTHGYPQNLLAATSPDRFADWLSARAADARELGVPLVVGEVGIPREWADRAQWFSTFFDRAQSEGVSAVLPWIARPYEESRDDAHGVWFWGPHAEESELLRAILRQQSKRANLLSLRTPGAEPAGFPLGVQTIAAFVQGEYTESQLIAEPWAVTEGNAEPGTPAWALYALDASRARGALTGFDVRALAESLRVGSGPADEAIAPELRLFVDGTFIGRWSPDGFVADSDDESGETAAPSWSDKEVAWLRLEGGNPGGAAILRRFMRDLPGSETFAFEFSDGVADEVDDG